MSLNFHSSALKLWQIKSLFFAFLQGACCCTNTPLLWCGSTTGKKHFVHDKGSKKVGVTCTRYHCCGFLLWCSACQGETLWNEGWLFWMEKLMKRSQRRDGLIISLCFISCMWWWCTTSGCGDCMVSQYAHACVSTKTCNKVECRS